jgi:hypothetical protein
MNAVTKLKPDAPATGDTLAGALAAAFAEIEGATKSANNPHFKSKYADLTAVIEAIKPALIAHDLFFTQRPQPSEGGVSIETVIGHANGEELSLGTLFVPANKNDAQGFGSALTYARRYALVTAFGVPVEDDDGNAASKATAPAPNRQEMPDHEWAKLVQLVEATNTDAGRMCKNYGVNNLRLLNLDQYADAIRILEDRLAKMAKADTNAKATEDA